MQITHPNYPGVDIRFDKFRSRNPPVIGEGSSFAMKGSNNIFERSYTGRLIQVCIEDGTVVQSYQEMRELPGYNNFRLLSVNLVYGYDSSVIKVESTGEIVVLDAAEFTGVDRVERSRLNMSALSVNKSVAWSLNASHVATSQLGNRLTSAKSQTEKLGLNQSFELGVPVGLKELISSYFMQLFLPREERSEGVFTVNIDKRIVSTIDRQGNHFKVRSDGEVYSHISVSFNLEQKNGETWNNFPKFSGREFTEEKNKDLPVPEK